MAAITVTITSDGEKMDEAYGLRSLDIRKTVNKISHAELVLIDGKAAEQKFVISDSDFFKPGKFVEIQIRDERDGVDHMAFKGIIVKHSVQASRIGSYLKVGLKDAAFGLTMERKSVLFEETSDQEIFEKILNDFNLLLESNKALTFKGLVESTTPVHPSMVQFYSTDWDFILSRAEANGAWVLVNDGTITIQKPDLSKSEQHTIEYGSDLVFDFDFEADIGKQQQTIQSTAWDIETQQMFSPETADSFDLAQTGVDPEAGAKAIGAEKDQLIHGAPLEPEELKAWANAKMIKTRMALIRGRMRIRGEGLMAIGDLIKIEGIGDKFNGKTIITGLRHQVDKMGWTTDLQFGLSADWFYQTPNILDTPSAGLLPAVHGLQVGMVDEFETDPKNQFRVPVRVPAIGDGTGRIWARLASLDSGNERGILFRPETGDEVVLGFLGDDPRQAIILGSLHSKSNPPPMQEEINAENFKKGIFSRENLQFLLNDENKSISLKTPEGNLICLTDDTEQDRAGIACVDQFKNCLKTNKTGISLVDDSGDKIVIEKDKTITIEDKGGNKVILDNQNGITLEDKNGGTVIMDSNGISLESASNIILKGKEISIEGSSKVEVTGKAIEIN